MQDPVAQVRTQSALLHDIHGPTEQCFHVLFEGDQVEQVTSRLEFHEEIDVTGLRGRSSRVRTKDAHTHGAVAACDAPDLFAVSSGQVAARRATHDTRSGRPDASLQPRHHLTGDVPHAIDAQLEAMLGGETCLRGLRFLVRYVPPPRRWPTPVRPSPHP